MARHVISRNSKGSTYPPPIISATHVGHDPSPNLNRVRGPLSKGGRCSQPTSHRPHRTARNHHSRPIPAIQRFLRHHVTQKDLPDRTGFIFILILFNLLIIIIKGKRTAHASVSGSYSI
jgi:hypothetical protein